MWGFHTFESFPHTFSCKEFVPLIDFRYLQYFVSSLSIRWFSTEYHDWLRGSCSRKPCLADSCSRHSTWSAPWLPAAASIHDYGSVRASTPSIPSRHSHQVCCGRCPRWCSSPWNRTLSTWRGYHFGNQSLVKTSKFDIATHFPYWVHWLASFYSSNWSCWIYDPQCLSLSSKELTSHSWNRYRCRMFHSVDEEEIDPAWDQMMPSQSCLHRSRDQNCSEIWRCSISASLCSNLIHKSAWYEALRWFLM